MPWHWPETRVERGRGLFGLMALLLCSGCLAPATGAPPGGLMGPHLRYRSASPPALYQPDTEDSGSGGTVGGAELSRYMAFVRERQAALKQPGVPEAERQAGQAALMELLAWLHGKTEVQLSREAPLEVYLRMKVQRVLQRRDEEARGAVVEAKLEEFHRWAEARSRALAEGHFRKAGRQWLLTESPVYEETQKALVSAVLAWAYAHTDDPDFPRRSPSEVALYLLAKRSHLATALAAGNSAPPTLDSVPEHRDEVPPEELVLELAVGLVPVVGEGADLGGLLMGLSVTGRELSPEERLLCAVGVLLPVVSGRMLAGGTEVAERTALLTGRGLQEVQVLQRVAQHLSPRDVEELQRVVRAAGRGEAVAEVDLAKLRELARRLEGPLADAARTLKAGQRIPLLGSRVSAEGMRLIPGSAEHMAQAWVDYQFRHPGKYPHFTYAVDEDWERLYRTVLKNKAQGGEFEQAVLKARGHEKNTAIMLPPPGSKDQQGFVPDSVVGSPDELVWGKPYHFVEVKGRAGMALTGNLEAMLKYVEGYGGFLEVYFRSAGHPNGQTRLTQRLLKRLSDLAGQGRARIQHFP